ncbi:hypothetical protein CK203_030417 [Vitis vinifera]|uniref:Uncharacterized protein n=1 Tax=Vitis vinifera TaxID=29760 RepID=A0A438IVJ0_VITVI|nr:hypothetical protein CK203_030417 [Vitis vinifera]
MYGRMENLQKWTCRVKMMKGDAARQLRSLKRCRKSSRWSRVHSQPAIAWGKKLFAGLGNPRVGRQMMVDLGRRPKEKGQVTEGQIELMKMGRPKSPSYKDSEVEMDRSREARAPSGIGRQWRT